MKSIRRKRKQAEHPTECGCTGCVDKWNRLAEEVALSLLRSQRRKIDLSQTPSLPVWMSK